MGMDAGSSLLIAFTLISPVMLLYELALFAVYMTLVRVQARKKNEDYRRLYAATETYSGFIGETIRAVMDIKLLHSEEGFIEKMEDVTGSYTNRGKESAERDNRHLLIRKQFVSWTSFIYLIFLALLKDYPVIMLDEATSALDNETQTAIRDAVRNPVTFIHLRTLGQAVKVHKPVFSVCYLWKTGPEYGKLHGRL